MSGRVQTVSWLLIGCFSCSCFKIRKKRKKKVIINKHPDKLRRGTSFSDSSSPCFWKLAPFECNRRQAWTLTFVSHVAQRRPPVAEWDMNVYLGAWCRLILWVHFSTLYYRPKDYSVYRIYWYTWQGLMFIQSYSSCFVQSVFLRRYFPCILEILS